MTRDDISCTTGTTNSTTFIGVIDVLDNTARRASMMKKSIAKSARNIRPSIKKGAFQSDRRASAPSNQPLEEYRHNPFDDSDEEDRMPPSPATKGIPLAAKLAAIDKSDCGSSKSSKKSKKRITHIIRDHQSLIDSEEKQCHDTAQREARKERVKEKLEKYKQDRQTLRSNCSALEAQLLETAEKLREVDSKAAYKIDSLEVELQKTREGMESLVHHSTKEVTDQSHCIKTLGKKLIRQAHVIKQQKKAVEEYQIQLEALREEMAMQDERDSSRDCEYNDLKEDFERTLQQKVAMQDSLQESIEEMMDLRHEREMATARIRELELTLEEKEIDLERAKRENGELSGRVTALETELQDKTDECEVVSSKLQASEQSVDVFKSELKRMNAEIEELREKADSLSDSQHATRRESSFKGWKRGSSAATVEDESTLQEKLDAKESQIHALDEAAKENEEIIKSLRSDMVKMSSTFKQEDYLRRKQIAKLKQDNAEYALKLRALEKAFKGVNPNTTSLSSSLHSKSMHASMAPSKQDMAQAVKSRLGGSSLAPYEFPEQTSETWSDEGRKGEWPEEC